MRKEVSKLMSEWSLRRIGWTIFLLAFCIRILFIGYSRQYLDTDENTELVAVAHSLATSGEFADPYKVPTGPTAHVAPVYPFLLSLLYRVTGAGQAAEIAKEVLASSASSLLYALLPACALAFGIPLRSGIWAGMAGAVVPLFPRLETKGEWEAPYAALTLLLLLMHAARSRPADDLLVEASLRGLAYGAALMLAPALLPVLVAVSIVETWKYQTFRHVAVVALVCLAVQLPWVLRNTIALGSPAWARDNLGLELALAFNSKALPTGREILETSFSDLHPNGSLSEANKVRLMGEIEYNREKLRDAISWISSHPSDFTRLVSLRTFYFWFPKIELPSKYLGYWVVSALAFVGLWRMIQLRIQPGFVLIGVTWLVYPLIYYLLQSFQRYLYPIYWSLLLSAAFAVYSMGERWRRG